MCHWAIGGSAHGILRPRIDQQEHAAAVLRNMMDGNKDVRAEVAGAGAVGSIA